MVVIIMLNISQHSTALASIDNDEEQFDNEDNEYSPIASNIESDLDILDQSGREFPESGGSGSSRRISPIQQRDSPC